ncbi:MAG: 2-C-methyl-D-erythritol 4-phosphate cytidylyltransferase [Candidatus Omnitrophica bacterium]|nr:2-C-methyl-D-erythritol 4-phosphate cytidylyltransferase [Candidatus Omnitrophota bacterium]
MYLSAIVLAAGKSSRFENKVSKPLVYLAGRPVITHSLKNLAKNRQIKDIIVVVNSSNKDKIAWAIKKYRINKISGIVLGGRRRQDSVFNGLKAIDDKTGLVLIHDAARPLVGQKTILAVIRQAKRTGAAITGVPVKSTIKEVHSPQSTVHSCPMVKKTIDRRNLWEAQTPQVFKKEIILRAYDRFNNEDFTDDATLVEKLGVSVNIIMGAYSNIKITIPEDLAIAEAILKKGKGKENHD